MNDDEGTFITGATSTLKTDAVSMFAFKIERVLIVNQNETLIQCLWVMLIHH